MKIKINIFLCSIFLIVFLSSCSTTTGTITRGYNTTKDKIWYSMKEVIKKDYGGIKRLDPDPPTVVSGVFMKDQQFGIDKTGYQAYVSLSGFTRPYVVDVEVRVFPEGYETQKYSTDRSKAQEILNKITQHINDKKYNMSMQEEFAPF